MAILIGVVVVVVVLVLAAFGGFAYMASNEERAKRFEKWMSDFAHRSFERTNRAAERAAKRQARWGPVVNGFLTLAMVLNFGLAIFAVCTGNQSLFFQGLVFALLAGFCPRW